MESENYETKPLTLIRRAKIQVLKKAESRIRNRTCVVNTHYIRPFVLELERVKGIKPS